MEVFLIKEMLFGTIVSCVNSKRGRGLNMINLKEYRKEEFPKNALVACQGVSGAFSQQAANILFEDPDIMYMRTFDGVF